MKTDCATARVPELDFEIPAFSQKGGGYIWSFPYVLGQLAVVVGQWCLAVLLLLRGSVTAEELLLQGVKRICPSVGSGCIGNGRGGEWGGFETLGLMDTAIRGPKDSLASIGDFGLLSLPLPPLSLSSSVSFSG